MKTWCSAAVLSIVLALTACIGCDSPDTRQADGVDLKYRVVTVEGRKWIAYQGAYGFTHLAGPIDDKSPQNTQDQQRRRKGEP